MDDNKIKPTILQNISEAERVKLKEKSAQSLPDVPSVHHWTPKQFKNAITKCLFDNKDSFYEFINRLALDTGLKFDEILAQIITMDVYINDINELVFKDYLGVEHNYRLASSNDANGVVLNDLANVDGEKGKIYLENGKFLTRNPNGEVNQFGEPYIKEIFDDALPYIGGEEPNVEENFYQKVWFDTGDDENNFARFAMLLNDGLVFNAVSSDEELVFNTEETTSDQKIKDGLTFNEVLEDEELTFNTEEI